MLDGDVRGSGDPANLASRRASRVRIPLGLGEGYVSGRLRVPENAFCVEWCEGERSACDFTMWLLRWEDQG